jgi:hypothetical protein
MLALLSREVLELMEVEFAIGSCSKYRTTATPLHSKQLGFLLLFAALGWFGGALRPSVHGDDWYSAASVPNLHAVCRYRPLVKIIEIVDGISRSIDRSVDWLVGHRRQVVSATYVPS